MTSKQGWLPTVWCFAFVLLQLCARPEIARAQSPNRTFQPSDLNRFERLGAISLSPDGKLTAFTVIPSKVDAHSIDVQFDEGLLQGNDRGQVWLTDNGLGISREITDGRSSGKGYWQPRWSPDSAHLAMLSIEGAKVRVVVWSKEDRELITLDGDLSLTGSSDDQRFAWLNNRQLAYLTSTKVSNLSFQGAESTATHGWKNSREGRIPTADVLASPPDSALDASGPLESLAIADISTRNISKVAVRAVEGNSTLSVSPDGKSVAVFTTLKAYSSSVRNGEFTDPNAWISELQFITSAGEVKVKKVFVGMQLPGWNESALWSPKGNEVAFHLIRPTVVGSDVEAKWFRCSVLRGECEDMSQHSNASIEDLLWLPDGRPIVYVTNDTNVKDQPRTLHQWLLVADSNHTMNLTQSLNKVPSSLYAVGKSSCMFGVAGDEFWRICPETNQTAKIALPIQGSQWEILPDEVQHGGNLIVAGQSQDGMVLYEIDLSQKQVHRLSMPTGNLVLSSFRRSGDSYVFSSSKNDSLIQSFWVCTVQQSKCTVLREFNAFLTELREAPSEQIYYRSTRGQNLAAWLLLPIDYRSGEKYPTIVKVYPGDNPPERPEGIAGNSFLNLQLFAAHGYAVLVPSMPLPPEGSSTDPYDLMLDGVIPAIDKAIEMGVVDPDRIGLIGHSYGGYGVYSLVSQTKRFKVAAAVAGIADLISEYGTFALRCRYGPNPCGGSDWTVGQGRMGNPPWQDAERYVHNSPLFHADKIETPLMIVQGDFDGSTIEQGEEMFNALLRQNRRAQFVRYWGEEHWPESPSNLEDFWRRIYAWFDEFLRPDTHSK